MTDGKARAPGLHTHPGSPVTLVLTGEWDDADAPRLRAAFDTLTADPGLDVIHVDTADLSFCDSSILGEFVRAHHVLSLRGGRLALLRPHTTIRNYVTITGLASFLLVGEPQADDTPSGPFPSPDPRAEPGELSGVPVSAPSPSSLHEPRSMPSC